MKKDAPNIIIVLIDDLGCRDLSCFGSSFYETPCLDALCREGMKFERAYASAPVCSPTRASIMTGKYPARVGITQYIGGKSEGKLQDVPYLHYLPLEEKSIASALREGGYQTWHIGKWHLGDEPFYPQHHGFDVNIGGCHMGNPGKDGYFSPYKVPIPPGPEGEFLNDRLTNEAIHLIRQRERSRPFFLHLSHYAVHQPIAAPLELVKKYERKAHRLGLDQINPIVIGENFPCLHKQHLRIERRILQSHPVYAALIENLDWNIGRLVQALKEENVWDNTLLVFTSDNGGLSTAEGSPTCNFPYLEGKGWCYEGGIRVCQIITWPKVIRPGTVCYTPITSTDFYPTFLAAAGLDLLPDQHTDGCNLMPILEGQGPLERKAIFWHYPHYSNQGGTPAASVLVGPWKLIEFFEDGHLELYHIDHDPSEQQNLVKEYPEKTKSLHETLTLWRQSVEALTPQPNPQYLKNRVIPSIPNNAHE